VYYLENKELDIVDARCNHEVYLGSLHGYTVHQQYRTLLITNWCT